MRRRRRAVWTAGLALVAGLAPLSTTACFPHRAVMGMGTAVDVLPDGFVTLTVGGGRYFYHGGIFYRPHRGGFLVVPAPYGAVVEVPPPGHATVLVEQDPYAFHRGVFYQPRGDRWVVVRPPLGAFVRSLPSDAVTRRVGGVEYREYVGVWYRPAIRDGARGWQVAERPAAG